MTDDEYMGLCLELARQAAAAGEVPVGAVVVRDGEVIGAGYNQPIGEADPTAHAEIVAIREAAKKAGNYRLPDAELFVTLEPCVMCAGAVIQARLRRVTFACSDPKAGFVGSIDDVSADPRLNHRFAVRSGLRADEARGLLVEFFRRRRG